MTEPEKDDLSRAERIFVRINFVQTILAVAGVFTGAVALYAALNESDAVRKQQRAGVLPYVTVGVSRATGGDEPYFGYRVFNSGIGPGRIAAMRVSVDGEAKQTWRDVLETYFPGGEHRYYYDQAAGRMISPGTNFSIFNISGDLDRIRSLSVGAERIRIEMCFCSVFEECWNVSEDMIESPQPVKQCPDYGAEQFLE